MQIYIIELQVKNLSPFETTNYGGEEIYKFFLTVISSKYPKTATNIHDTQDLNPFSVTPFITNKKPQKGKIKFQKNEILKFNINIFKKDLFEKALKTMQNFLLNNNTVKFENLELKLKEYKQAILDLNKLAKSTQNKNLKKIEMNFKSPTVIKVKNKVIPFPLPEYIFPSIKRKIEKFFKKIIKTEDFSKIKVEKYNLKTEFLKFKKFNLIGFKGKVIYNLEDLNLEERKEAGFLALFSPCGGVGYKTSMGLGWVDKVVFY